MFNARRKLFNSLDNKLKTQIISVQWHDIKNYIQNMKLFMNNVIRHCEFLRHKFSVRESIKEAHYRVTNDKDINGRLLMDCPEYDAQRRSFCYSGVLRRREELSFLWERKGFHFRHTLKGKVHWKTNDRVKMSEASLERRRRRRLKS